MSFPTFFKGLFHSLGIDISISRQVLSFLPFTTMSGLLAFISLSVWTGMSQSIVAIWFSVTVAGSCYYHYHYHFHYHYHHYYSGAPYSYGKQKETHDLIFSWLSWLAAGIARGRVCTTATATVESRNVTAILQITG